MYSKSRGTSHIRKQPPRPIDEISVRQGYLPGKCLYVRGIGVSWKIVCVRGLDRTSWKTNTYLFDEKTEAPGKFVCVRGLNKGFWEN